MTKYNQTNLKDFVIDKKTGAILNLDNRSLELYRMKIEKAKNEQKLTEMEDELSQIKNLLSKILKETTKDGNG